MKREFAFIGFVALVGSIICLSGCDKSNGQTKQSAEESAKQFIAKVNEGDYGYVWDNSAEESKKLVEQSFNKDKSSNRSGITATTGIAESEIDTASTKVYFVGLMTKARNFSISLNNNLPEKVSFVKVDEKDALAVITTKRKNDDGTCNMKKEDAEWKLVLANCSIL